MRIDVAQQPLLVRLAKLLVRVHEEVMRTAVRTGLSLRFRECGPQPLQPPFERHRALIGSWDGEELFSKHALLGLLRPQLTPLLLHLDIRLPERGTRISG
ncbi:MAG: hypothetical protein P8Y07_15230 [Gemmatimonadales bacterium]